MEPINNTPEVASQAPAPSSSLLKNPMVWLGLGAVIILFLGGLFLFSKEPKSTATSTPTSVTTVMEPTGTIEIQEQKEVDAIQVGDVDADFTEIDQQVNQL